MTDVALRITELGADLALEGGDLALDEGLATGVLVSLFSDRRVELEEGADPLQLGRRGWWPDGSVDRWGSRIWQLQRAKATAANAQAAKVWTEEALRWLVEEGIAESVTVTTQLVQAVRDPAVGTTRELLITVSILRGAGWPDLWANVLDESVELGGLRLSILHA